MAVKPEFQFIHHEQTDKVTVSPDECDEPVTPGVPMEQPFHIRVKPVSDVPYLHTRILLKRVENKLAEDTVRRQSTIGNLFQSMIKKRSSPPR